MSNINKYLADAKARAHKNFNNVDGFIDDRSFTGGDDFFQGVTGNPYAASQPAGTSQPYIINIVSTSGAAVSNFSILGSNTYLYGAGWTTDGNLVVGGVTISSGIPNVSYREMLAQFQQSPFSVGMTYMQSATQLQILQTIALNTKDANGNSATKALIPTIDPYQQQTNIIVMKQGYRIDGFTQLTIAQILPNATVQIQLYPSDQVNIARVLAGTPVAKEYGNPGIVKEQIVKIA